MYIAISNSLFPFAKSFIFGDLDPASFRYVRPTGSMCKSPSNARTSPSSNESSTYNATWCWLDIPLSDFIPDSARIADLWHLVTEPIF